jgi:predicted Zn-dependent peptidase
MPEQFWTTELNNKFRFNLTQDPALQLSRPTAFMVLAVGSGSSRDGLKQRGLAHVAEHLAGHRLDWDKEPDREYVTTLKKAFDRGQIVRGDSRTEFDYTLFFLGVPLVYFKEACQFLSMSLERSLITHERFETCIREVILEKQEKLKINPFCGAYDLLYETAFVQSPYRSYTLGHLEDIEALSAVDGIRFYEENYNPSNASLFCLTGPWTENWDQEKMRETVEATFGGFGDQKKNTELKIEEPAQMAFRSAKMTSDEGIFLAGLKAPPYSRLNEPAQMLLNKILVNGKSEFRRCAADQLQGLGSQTSMARHSSLIEILALTKTPNSELFSKMKSALEEDFDRIKNGRFETDDIDDAKKRVGVYLKDIQSNPVKRVEKMACANLLDGGFASWNGISENLQTLESKFLKDLASRSFDWNQVTLVTS